MDKYRGLYADLCSWSLRNCDRSDRIWSSYSEKKIRMDRSSSNMLWVYNSGDAGTVCNVKMDGKSLTQQGSDFPR